MGQVVSSPGMECHISGAWGSGILACCLVGLAGVSTLSNNLDAVLMLSGMLSQEGSGGESKRTGRGGVCEPPWGSVIPGPCLLPLGAGLVSGDPCMCFRACERV